MHVKFNPNWMTSSCTFSGKTCIFKPENEQKMCRQTFLRNYSTDLSHFFHKIDMWAGYDARPKKIGVLQLKVAAHLKKPLILAEISCTCVRHGSSELGE